MRTGNVEHTIMSWPELLKASVDEAVKRYAAKTFYDFGGGAVRNRLPLPSGFRCLNVLGLQDSPLKRADIAFALGGLQGMPPEEVDDILEGVAGACEDCALFSFHKEGGALRLVDTPEHWLRKLAHDFDVISCRFTHDANDYVITAVPRGDAAA